MMNVLVLKTCDTCRKARKWLDAQGVDYVVRDVRAEPLDEQEIKALVDIAGWEKLLNKSSTTWRGLPDTDKTDLDDDKAIKLLVANPTLLKRPVVQFGQTVIIGFKPAQQEEIANLIS